MPIFVFNKLVRDFIIKLQEQDGIVASSRVLDDENYRQALIEKLHEESDEIASAGPDDILGELADLQQVLDDLTVLSGHTNEERLDKQRKKKERAGGFEGRVFLTEIEVPADSSWLKYYQDKPEQYPER